MIVGHELQQWLADGKRQRDVVAAGRTFRSAWNRGPVQRLFADAMADLPDESPEAVAGAVNRLFADTAWVETLLDDLAAELARDPYFEPPFPSLHSDIHSGILVFEDERVSIAAGVTGAVQLATKKNVKRGASSIGFTGYVSVLRFVRSGGAYLSFWEAPPITADFVGAEASRCVRTGGRRVVDGETLTLDGRFQSYVIERASSDMVVLQASIKCGQAPLSVEYDSKTHDYVGSSATADGASRIQMMTTLLRKMECEDAFPVMASFLDDPNFFVRWHVMREMLGLDAVAALPHLHRMAREDAHPDVRRAAGSVLDRLFIQHPGLHEHMSCPA